MQNEDSNGVPRKHLGQITLTDLFSTRNSHDIDKLNALVAEKSKSFLLQSKISGKPLAPEILAVLDEGAVVYKERWTAIPMGVIAFALLLLGCNYDKPLTLIIAIIFTFLWYDFFSGVLHIVLDNPGFIKLPVLGEPCLEFQWHHHIPSDLASKSFMEVCGDLNLVILSLIAVYLLPIPHIGFHYRSPLALSLVSCKCLMAYFGQLCHCMSHTPANRRPTWVRSLQEAHLMISPKEHAVHHKTYDCNFCIGSGICNPLIAWLLNNVTSNQWVWLLLFIVTLVGDVPIVNHLLTSYGGFQ